MKNGLVAAVAGICLFAAGSVAAQGCGGTYTVQRGDSLSVIADGLYKDARKWSVIYNTNVGTIGDSPNKIRVGQRLTMPCIGGLPTGLSGATATAAAPAPKPAATGAAAALQAAVSRSNNGDAADPGLIKVRLLTADDYAPFTDRDSLNGGLVTEIVQAAMEQSGTSEFGIHWVNDWSAHLEPLLSEAMLDMGFPWLQPDCAQSPDQYRCENFHFSEPMFEMLVLLFTDRGNPLLFREDADIIGKTLCRPKGYYTHDLDKDGRNWLKGNMIRLEQPSSVADCFELLTEGKVDAVALNEFTGRKAVKDLGLENRVEPVQSRPLSIEGLHVLVHKSHPKAEALLSTVNRGLDAIKSSGTYQQIIDRHMSKIWEDL